jgi:pilus assembly protein Flp/PilA
MHQSVRDFLADNSGVTVIEYGLIAILIGVVFIATMGSIGSGLDNLFTTVSTKV